MEKLIPSELNRNIAGRATFSVLGMFRNEAHILREWIEHYLLFGADRIYLINNNSTDRYSDALDPYLAKGIVKLFHCPIDRYQIRGYSELLPTLLAETDWVGIFDLDEFIYPRRASNIISVINDFKTAESILIPWLSFGSSRHEQQPITVVDHFLMRGSADTSRAFLKSILRPSRIVYLTTHNPKTISSNKVLANGEPLGDESFINLSEDAVSNYALINNHYRLQSRQYFADVKTKRPSANESETSRPKWLEFFDEHDREWNQIRDDTLSVLSRLRRDQSDTIPGSLRPSSPGEER